MPDAKLERAAFPAPAWSARPLGAFAGTRVDWAVSFTADQTQSFRSQDTEQVVLYVNKKSVAEQAVRLIRDTGRPACQRGDTRQGRDQFSARAVRGLCDEKIADRFT